MDHTIALRPITPEDLSFLYRVYASTREDEMKLVDWDDAQKQVFVQMQFTAQHKFYTKQLPRAHFNIIELDNQPIGRLYVDRRADEIRIVDIALLPAYRNQGIGSRFLNDLLAEARQAGLPVSIHVERNNPAMQLYRRLGFQPVHDTGVYILMECRP